MAKFKLGSDPELMLTRAGGELASAIPIIPEGKTSGGRPLDAAGENRVIHDNVMVEFNTAPANSETEFINTIGTVLQAIQALLLPQQHQLHLQASADFPESELLSEEAREFGCTPDFNAWTLKKNKIAADAAEQPFRSAGGHLHIGMADDEALNAILADDYGKVEVVKTLDIFCGVPSVFLDPDLTAARRRALYGGAGAHRPKTYGVEYRALGNWWLRSPRHTSLVYKLTAAGLDCLLLGRLRPLIKRIKAERVQNIINSSDAKQAWQVYQRYIQPELPADLVTEISALKQAEVVNFNQAWQLATLAA